MSEVAGKSSLPSSNGKGSRRRRPTGKGPRAPKVDAEPSTGTPAEAAPKRERQEITPVPEELMGTKATGTVVVTIRNRKFNFGFISLAHGEKAEDITVPRVYYNPSYISEEGLNLYRGYEVAFEIAKDEENRTIAKGITLTEAGKAIKEERDAAAATKRAERAAEKAAAVAAAPAKKAEKAPETTANGEEGAPKEGSKRRRRPRRRGDAKPAEEGEAAVEKPKKEPREPREPRAPRRSATFTITVEGDASKNGTLDYAISQSIGRLKSLAAKAVDASLDLSVYLVTAEAPRGVFLTRAVLNTVGETGTILLANKREEDNIPAAAATEEK